MADATRDPPPLRPEHLPDPATIDQPVSLSALTHLRGVNALAPDQTLTFGPALTIVYGANAAGKSGYTRILKRACRARGAEEILGNVVSGTLPKRPSSRIVCEKNGQREEYRWNDDQPPNPLLSQVSVFDHHCASVYVAKKTDVAYRPLGLDLFDQLAAVCDGVARILEKERRALESVTPSLPQFPPNTQPAKLLHRLTSLTDPFSVIQLARLSEADEERIHTILRALADLRSDAPLKRARELELHLNRVQSLAQELNMLSQASSSEVVSALFSAKSSQQDTKVLLDDMNRRVFIAQPLPNTGSQAWHNLWNAAKQYSAHDAYPSHQFPFTGSGARCVLCQQELQQSAKNRLVHFQEANESSIQREHHRATDTYEARLRNYIQAHQLTQQAEDTLREVELANRSLAAAIRTALNVARAHESAVSDALGRGLPDIKGVPAPAIPIEPLHNYMDELADRISDLRGTVPSTAVEELQAELAELRARKLLADNLDQVLDIIERRKRIAA